VAVAALPAAEPERRRAACRNLAEIAADQEKWLGAHLFDERMINACSRR
jgi:hypothetical protein